MANPILLLVAYSAAAFYGTGFFFNVIGAYMRHPFSPSAVWKVQNRPVAPDVLKDYGKHDFVQLSNVKLHYVHNGDPSKPMMLFLHGYPEFWYTWRHQLKEFSKDHWAVAIDMRGYGESGKPEGIDKYKIEHLVGDVKEFIQKMGKSQCTLVAHDWGGMVAWNLILPDPKFVNAYVIINSPHPIAYNNALKKNVFQFIKSLYVFFYQLPKLPELRCRMEDMAIFNQIFKSNKSPKSISEKDLEAYKYTYGKPGAFTYPLNYYRANVLDNSYWKNMEGTGKDKDFPPGLLLFGDQDLALDKHTIEEGAKMVQNARFVPIKGANHFAQWDEPTSVNREIRKFLNEVNPEQ